MDLPHQTARNSEQRRESDVVRPDVLPQHPGVESQNLAGITASASVSGDESVVGDDISAGNFVEQVLRVVEESAFTV